MQVFLPSVSAAKILAAAVDGFFQFRAGDELCNFFGRNFQRRTGLGITAGSRLARADREGTEADQGHFAPFLQRRYNSVERGIESIACRSEEHTSELQSQSNLVCRLLLEKKKKTQ